MKNFINSLFIQMGLQASHNDDIDLFYYKADCNKKVYWAIVEWNDLEQLTEQSTIFNRCRELIDHPELDKNLSLIILIKLNEPSAIANAKSSIIKVEENAYYFKKYVLHYADAELEELKKQQGEKTDLDFLTHQVVNSECFKSYKVAHKIISWQSLVYRIAVKIPLIPITIKTNKGLASLFEDNQLKVTNKNLSPVDDHLSEKYARLSIKEIEALSADDILGKLIPLIK